MPSPSNEGGSNFCKPQQRKQPVPSALVVKIMEMGFARRSIEFAIAKMCKL